MLYLNILFTFHFIHLPVCNVDTVKCKRKIISKPEMLGIVVGFVTLLPNCKLSKNLDAKTGKYMKSTAIF